MSILKALGRIILNFLARLVEVVIFVVILGVVGNNPRFFGNMSQYLVDGTKSVCSYFGYSWGTLQGIGLTASLLTVLAAYVIVRFVVGLIANGVTGRSR